MLMTKNHYDKYIGIVLYQVSRHTKLSHIDHYDLIQAGLQGLAEGLNKYDKRKGASESSWVFFFIRSAIIKARYYKGKEYQEYNGYEGEEDINNKTEKNACLLIIDAEIQADDDARIVKIKKILYSPLRYLTKDNNLNRRIYEDYMLKKNKIIVLVDKYGLTKCALWHRIRNVSRLIRQTYQTYQTYQKENTNDRL